MPKTPIDYSKSVIYKIEHIDKPELVYVGSTTNFTKRKCQHKNNCNYNNKNENLYKMIREHGNWESFKMMIICEFPCNSKIELVIKEEKHRKELQANLNSYKCYVNNKENKECQIEYGKKYYNNNKEKINKQLKEYRNNNKEKIKEYEKEYRNNNKEKIKEKRKELFNCICGTIFVLKNKSRHDKSIKHINFINNNLEQCNDIEIDTPCNSIS